MNRIDTRKDAIKVSSRATRVPLQIRPGSRYGMVSLAGGALGRGTATHYDAATLTPLASRIAVEINQDALDQTSGDPKSIRKLLSQEIKNAMRELRVQLNGQLQLAGDGILATVSAAAGTQITVKNAPFYAQLLRAGQIVSVYDSTVTTLRGTATIASIDQPNSVLNVDAIPGGTVSGDVLLPEGVSGANPVGYFGIRYHHSDSAVGNWMNLSRVTNPEVRANAVHNGSNGLTTAPIRLLLTKIIQRVGNVNPKQLAAHLHMAQAAAYEELAVLVTEIHKGSGNEAIDMLFGSQRLAGVNTLPDLHAARDRIDFMNFDVWGKVESAPVDFLKTPDGRYFDRPIDVNTGSQIASVIFWIYWFGGTKELAELKLRYIGGTLKGDNTEATRESGESVETTRAAFFIVTMENEDIVRASRRREEADRNDRPRLRASNKLQFFIDNPAAVGYLDQLALPSGYDVL